MYYNTTLWLSYHLRLHLTRAETWYCQFVENEIILATRSTLFDMYQKPSVKNYNYTRLNEVLINFIIKITNSFCKKKHGNRYITRENDNTISGYPRQFQKGFVEVSWRQVVQCI